MKQIIKMKYYSGLSQVKGDGCTIYQGEVWQLGTVVSYSTESKEDIIVEPPHDKTDIMTVRSAKTQISLGICPV